MSIGRLIDYTIRILGINVHWRTVITDYKVNRYFVDQQLRGPYSFWHHKHTFSVSGSGTQINDTIYYSLPLGIAGRIAHYLFVKKMLHTIFNYRQDVISKIFVGAE